MGVMPIHLDSSSWCVSFYGLVLRPLLVDDPCCDLLGKGVGLAPFEQAVRDVLVLALQAF